VAADSDAFALKGMNQQRLLLFFGLILSAQKYNYFLISKRLLDIF